MKVTSKKDVDFKPIKLEIVIENKEEQNALYSLFSYLPLCEWFVNECGVEMGVIREKIGKSEYGKAFDSLEQKIKRR
jgi:hypothetical protein